MASQTPPDYSKIDKLAEDISAKIRAHRITLMRSHHGAIIFHEVGNGTYNIELKPTL